MKKLTALLLAIAMMVTCTLCAVAEDGKTYMAVCIASEPDTLDPALNSAVDGATMVAHLFAGLSTWAQTDDGKLEILPDCAVELPDPVVNDDGTVTYTYTLVDGLKWSDGKDLTAKDFEFAWKRAASSELGADYGYMFEVIKGYTTDGSDPKAENLAVTAVDNKTLTVTLNNPVAYWNELLAFPAYMPVREDVVANEAWATDPSTYIGNGPYTMTAWEHNSKITLTKNPYYHAVDKVTMDELDFYLSDDANNMLANFQKGDWQLIDDVPTSEIASLKEQYPTEFVIAGQIGTYYVCWNINEEILPADVLANMTPEEAEAARAEVRRAIGLLFDRNYIVEEIGQGREVGEDAVLLVVGVVLLQGLNRLVEVRHVDVFVVGHVVVAGDAFHMARVLVELRAVRIGHAHRNEAGRRHLTRLTDFFTNFPSLTYLYNTSEAHKAIGEYLQSAVSAVGITMNLTNQEWNTFLNTRKSGDYSIARNGWIADYNDPICFLDMWVTGSGNNDVQFGKGANADLKIYNLDLTPYGYDVKVENGTWAETYDVLISAIKSCTDSANRYAMMHIAEDMLMDTGCIVPLYYYTDIYMIDDSVQGFFSNPLGYKYFMHCTIAK